MRLSRALGCPRRPREPKGGLCVALNLTDCLLMARWRLGTPIEGPVFVHRVRFS